MADAYGMTTTDPRSDLATSSAADGHHARAGAYGNRPTVTSSRLAAAPDAQRWQWLLQGSAAALAAVVAAIHVVDQGGIGLKSPAYVGLGYWLLELTALAVAVLLCSASHKVLWLVAFGSGAGPLLGWVLSRGPGLPNYTDDRGNWTEPLGVASVVVEALLMAVAVAGVLSCPTRRARSTG